MPRDTEPAARWRENSSQRAECRGLAGTVGTNESQDLTGLDAKADAAHGDSGAITLVVILDDNGHSVALLLKPRRCSTFLNAEVDWLASHEPLVEGEQDASSSSHHGTTRA